MPSPAKTNSIFSSGAGATSPRHLKSALVPCMPAGVRWEAGRLQPERDGLYYKIAQEMVARRWKLVKTTPIVEHYGAAQIWGELQDRCSAGDGPITGPSRLNATG